MIFETRATASHRYYMNKKRSDIIMRIRDLRLVLLRHGILPPKCPIDGNGLGEGSQIMMKWSRHDLAKLAMAHHDLIPEVD